MKKPNPMANDDASDNRGNATIRANILEAAAECFMHQGFAATSVDDVARKMGATKGLVYHYYSSKIALLLDVHREGMDRLFAAVETASLAPGREGERLAAMLEAHANAMMDNYTFIAVVVQGVQMYRNTATTPDQRRALNELTDMRRRFEALFRATLEAAIVEGSAVACDPSVSVKAMLGAINWMSVWYRPRTDETAHDRRALAAGVVRQVRSGFERR